MPNKLKEQEIKKKLVEKYKNIYKKTTNNREMFCNPKKLSENYCLKTN